MKRIFKLFVVLFMFTVSVCFIKAECNDEELNEWATIVEGKFVENKSHDSEVAKYAYFLTIEPYREDVKIVVSDEVGHRVEGKKYEVIKLYGVGAFTNLEDETYTIEVYGNNKTCNGELLKTIDYTVPRFNRMSKDARCEENPDLEICKTFSNSTKNMTEDEFKKQLGEYIKENEPTTIRDIIISILGYSLFVIAPVILVGLFYIRQIRVVKKQQKNR